MASGFAQWGNDLHTGRKSYNIVGRRRTWFAIAITAVLASVLLLSIKGLNPGIEFRGGRSSRSPAPPPSHSSPRSTPWPRSPRPRSPACPPSAARRCVSRPHS
ncbi:hypothetical protein [Pengzhenrongella phosphoraccumulans]|uniref:hypothetical protein n=1 Tax=Pengzhenrongella phosphoraccumulans TaxID=3114394 RepID=UPI00388D6B27